MKYSIKKITKIDEIDFIYSNFIKYSPQKNIFCSKEILKFFFEDLELFLVLKKDKIKSFIYLLRDLNGSIIADPFIYSGIINHPKLLMKNARYNNEVFKINELIVKEIFSNYENLNINLPLNFKDIRPFLWFNYDKKDEKRFEIFPRYTSIIDLHSKDTEAIFSEIDDVKRRDIKKALSNEDYKVSAEVNLNLMKRFYIETMQKNKGNFDRVALNKIFEFMHIQAKVNKLIQATTYFQEKPIYSVLLLHDETTSCYLYGAGEVGVKNRYAGSLALWSAIEVSLKKNLLFVDLEGINSPYRGEYKLNFGGNIESYFKVVST